MFPLKKKMLYKVLFYTMIVCLAGITVLSIVNINRKGYSGTYSGVLEDTPLKISVQKSDDGYELKFTSLGENPYDEYLHGRTVTVDSDRTFSYLDYTFILERDGLYVCDIDGNYEIFKKSIGNIIPVFLGVFIVIFAGAWSLFIIGLPKDLKTEIITGIIMLAVIPANIFASMVSSNVYTGNVTGYKSIYSQEKENVYARTKFVDKEDYLVGFFEFNHVADMAVWFRYKDGSYYETTREDKLYPIAYYLDYNNAKYTQTVVDKSIFKAEIEVYEELKLADSFTLTKQPAYIYWLIFIMVPAYVLNILHTHRRKKLKVLKIKNNNSVLPDEKKGSYFVSGLIYSDRQYAEIAEYICKNIEGCKVVPGRKSLEFGDQIIEASKEKNHYISDSGLEYVFRDEETTAVLEVGVDQRAMFIYQLRMIAEAD
ncbi:MAG: hypothetical protein ACI4EW_00485 [Butyrivibrio sp.]